MFLCKLSPNPAIEFSIDNDPVYQAHIRHGQSLGADQLSVMMLNPHTTKEQVHINHN